MFKNVIHEMQQKPLGNLNVICARPGDGRRSFAIALANAMAAKGGCVYYCSIIRTRAYLENQLLPSVRFLNAFPLESLPKGAVIVVDTLSSFVLQEGLKHAPVGAYDKEAIQTALLLKLQKCATQRKWRVVVTETFAHASDPDAMLPLTKEALQLCDRAYILYKDSITANNLPCADTPALQIKEISLSSENV